MGQKVMARLGALLLLPPLRAVVVFCIGIFVGRVSVTTVPYTIQFVRINDV